MSPHAFLAPKGRLELATCIVDHGWTLRTPVRTERRVIALRVNRRWGPDRANAYFASVGITVRRLPTSHAPLRNVHRRGQETAWSPARVGGYSNVPGSLRNPCAVPTRNHLCRRANRPAAAAAGGDRHSAPARQTGAHAPVPAHRPSSGCGQPGGREPIPGVRRPATRLSTRRMFKGRRQLGIEPSQTARIPPARSGGCACPDAAGGGGLPGSAVCGWPLPGRPVAGRAPEGRRSLGG